MQKLKVKENGKKVKLGFYPYTYVRTAVMRSLLFNTDDYQKMLKMSFNEIAKFLQDSTYKNEINSLASKYSGAELLELALNQNLSSTYSKLLRISSPEMREVVSEYLKRKDFDDIKTILRGKFTNSEEERVLKSLNGAGTLSMEFLAQLLKKESVEDIIKGSKIVKIEELKKEISEFRQSNNLAALENSLDRIYYSQMLSFSQRLSKQGQIFKNFLLKEVETANILTIFRLKKANAGAEMIKNYLIFSGDKSKDRKIISLASAENIESLSGQFQKTEFRDIIKKGMEEYDKNGSLITLEIGMQKHLLQQSVSLLHLNLLSVDVMLAYMFAKDIEARNLKILIKGKELGLSEEFIESQLVMNK
ncbi:MAG TPA: ATP synthase A1 subunit C [Candidatus Nanoarchaeia archaeon]|nr:ATP synthase A1 subunit C [Candidatus Nanoarchaeia archaeon]